jgi:hypothetical protein
VLNCPVLDMIQSDYYFSFSFLGMETLDWIQSNGIAR